MQNMWAGFDDFDLVQLCFEYGIESICEFQPTLPIRLKNRSDIEQSLTELELEIAFGDY